MRVDTRAGSNELIEPLKAAGVVCEPATLPAGDIEIVGNGPEGLPLLVGVEYKTVEDVVACMRDGRFADQMRKMHESYQVNWLLIEGRVRDLGGLDVRRGEKWFRIPGNVTYQEFAAWTASMCQSTGVLLWRTENRIESVMWLRSLYMWWTAKTWEQHRAHLDWYVPPTVTDPFRPIPLSVKVAATLPHIGSLKAMRVAEFFKSVKRMCLAGPEEWVKIKGVGKKVAADVVRAIEEE